MLMEHLYIFDQVSSASDYGIGTYIRQLVSIWTERTNRKLTIVKMDASLENIEEFQCEGVRHLHLPLENDECTNLDEYHEALAEAFVTCMDDSEKNIMHFNYFHQYSLIEKIKLLMPSISVIMTIHYFDWGMLNGGGEITDVLNKSKEERTGKETAIYHAFKGNGSVLKSVDRIICLSEYSKHILKSMYHLDLSKVELIRNSLHDEYECLSVEEKINEKHRSSLHTDRKLILFVGRFDHNKGGWYLIQAFRKLVKIRQDIHLIMVGDGCMDLIKGQAEDIVSHITFTGRISKKEVYRLYRVADIGVLPSLYEQCSYVIIEMMMHGIPIIATDTSGLDEMLDDGCGGYKVSIKQFDSDGFVDDLMDSMHKMLAISNDELNAMRKYSRECYLEKYNLMQLKVKMNEVWSF